LKILPKTSREALLEPEPQKQINRS